MNRGITSVLFADDQKIISKTEDDIQEALYILLLWSNGRSWIYSISLLASQYSFDSSLEV